MKLKTGIKVGGPLPVVCKYEDFEEIRETVGDGKPVFTEVFRYPMQFKRPRIFVCADESGIHKPLPYSGWGLVGTFCVVKFASNGNLISLTEKEAEGICEELLNREGWTGYLDSKCGVGNPFVNAFERHGIPPIGWCPKERWFG